MGINIHQCILLSNLHILIFFPLINSDILWALQIEIVYDYGREDND